MSPLSPLSILLAVLLVRPPSAVRADPPPRFDAPSFCRPYLCGKGQEPVQRWPLSFKSTGCSQLGGIQMFSGAAKNSKFGSDDPHDACCDRRNACLQTCGAIKTGCDEVFFRCVRDVCAAGPGDDGASSGSDGCAQSSKVYELMINMEGCRQYDAEQHAHCDCVKKEDAPKRRRDVLHKFYKKFSPESLDKVDGLAKKADSPRKMASLLAKLVKKYPGAIQKIKDPKQEMMEKLMKEGREKEGMKEEDANDENDGGEDEDEEVQEL